MPSRRRAPQTAPTDDDSELQRALRLRRAQRLAELGEADHPASGTDRIAARLAEARARRWGGS